MGVGISRKFTSGPKKFQKLLWVHRPSNPTIDFLEMPTSMGESLCNLVRLDVKYAHYPPSLLMYARPLDIRNGKERLVTDLKIR